jgi:hypothetical protein
MVTAFAAEWDRQMASARRLLEDAVANSDDFLAVVASARIAELYDLARRQAERAGG